LIYNDSLFPVITITGNSDWFGVGFSAIREGAAGVGLTVRAIPSLACEATCCGSVLG
jgi:hypothetical protein